MSRFDSIHEVIKDLCLRSGDVLQRNKGLYLNCAKDVFLDLQLDSLKLTQREVFFINKRTNTVNLPKNALWVASVNVQDKCGNWHPVWRNDDSKLHDDLVEVGAAKDCACENKCGHALCNTIKGYEAVVSTKSDYLPNGDPISFTCTDRKAVDDNGFFYEQTQYPLRVYISGVWTDTVLHTENKTLCKLEVDDSGCVCDTEANVNAVCNSCGISSSQIAFGGTADNPPCDGVDTWIYYCNSKLDWFSYQCGSRCYKPFNNIYNISELGDRLIFPANFGFDKVMIRFYYDVNLKDIKVPIIAKTTFMKGLQAFSLAHNEKKYNLFKVFERDYTTMKWGLGQELNKYRIAELRMMTTPPVYVPSYIENRNRGYTY